jgi:hypothetical protein
MIMKPEPDFEKMATQQGEGSFVQELWAMLREKKKYWLLPIIAVLLVLGLLVVLSGTAIAPFIYTLF